MPKATAPGHIENTNDLKSSDKDRQNHPYQALLEMTNAAVPWAYDVRDELLRLIAKGGNRQRSSPASFSRTSPQAIRSSEASRIPPP